MSDKSLRDAVIAELEWEPSIDAEHIGVAVDGGVVTLTGHVGSYTERCNAEKVVKRVKGVRAIAEEIEVRFPNDKKTADDQIAKRALDVIAWDSTIPKDRIQVKVQNGLVTLTGEVDWFYQREDAEAAVRKLGGVPRLVG